MSYDAFDVSALVCVTFDSPFGEGCLPLKCLGIGTRLWSKLLPVLGVGIR